MGSRGIVAILSQIQKEVLLGTILGDAHLEKNGRYVRLKIDHGIKQQDYVEYKYEVFKEFAASRPKIISVFDSRNSMVYQHVRFNTKSIPELVNFWNIFYYNRRKKVPNEIIELFYSPLSLAIWFMDDGARRTDCNALRIHSTAYMLGENMLLKKLLWKNFGIKTNIHTVTKGSYALYIPANDARKFCSLIESHIVPSLRYKLL